MKHRRPLRCIDLDAIGMRPPWASGSEIAGMTQASVKRTLGQILGELKGIDDRLKRADDSRAVVHRRLDEVSERLSHVEGEVEATKKTVNDMKPVTDDMAQLRTQPAGAGTLGRWLIRISIGVVTPASWIDVGYTWLTGRPPP